MDANAAVNTVIAGSALIISVVALIRGETRHHRDAATSMARQAVESVQTELSRLYSVVEHGNVRPVTAAQVSAAMLQFESVWRQLQYLMPRGSRHLRPSIRAAMANCFGGPASVGVDPRTEQLPVNPFDEAWWEIGSSYIIYAQAQLSEWLTANRNRPLRLIQYYQWRSDVK